MKKINIWKVEGYAGFSDCDGPSDYNVNRTVAMDACFSQEQVVNFIVSIYKTRVVVIKVTLENEVILE